MVAQPNSLAGRDVASVIHPYTNLEAHKTTGPTVIAKGEGVYVYDDSGKKYLEGMAGPLEHLARLFREAPRGGGDPPDAANCRPITPSTAAPTRR